MYSNVIVGITISRGSFVFSQSRVRVSAMAVGAFDPVNCSLFVVGFVPVFHVGRLADQRERQGRTHQLTNHNTDWDCRQIWLTKTDRNPPMTVDKLYTSLSANTIMAKLTCNVQRTRFITSSTDKHYWLNSEDDLRSGCRNISHQQQFFSELPSPGRSYYTNYWYSWVQTIYYFE